MQQNVLPLDAVVFDLDDTLMRDDRSISDYTVQVMHRAARLGIHVIPASGRTFPSMLPSVRRLECARLCIACNGAEIWMPDGESPLLRLALNDDLAQQVLRFGQSYDCYIQAYHGNRFYYNQDGAYAAAYALSSTLQGERAADLSAFVAAHPTAKILMMHDESRIAQMLQDARIRFAGQLSVTCSKPYYLEFNPLQATKGNALRWCAQRLGFSLDRTVAFGDSLNDLSMLTAAGIGVAVDNAREDVKQQLAHHCGSNQKDGPARFLSRLLDGAGSIPEVV